MSYWDHYTLSIITLPDHDLGNGWVQKDCGCCNGIQWGGNEPIDCNICDGKGYYSKHKESGVLAK